MSAAFDRATAAHLSRRAGFGSSAGDVDYLVSLGREGAVDHLVNYENVDDSQMEKNLAQQNFDLTRFRTTQSWWLFRMIYTQRPLLEKMTLFWHGHFATAVRKVANTELMLQQNQLFRRLATGNFRTLVLEVSKDPAMILWLDNNTNIKGNPNENYARELMELFTTGINDAVTGQPTYTEQDIQEAARAFTGWTIRRNQFFFNASQHDDGTKTVLGQTGRWNGDDVVDILLRQRATARFIAKKLWEYFSYPNPEPAIIEELADVYFNSQYEIKPVIRRLLLMDAFYTEKARFATIKSPTELVVGSVRMLQADPNVLSLPAMMTLMEQDLFNPPDVSGWDGGMDWLNTATMLMRYNYANFLATARGGRTGTFSPEQLLQGKNLNSPEAVVDYLLRILGPLEVNDRTRELFTQFLANGNAQFALNAQAMDQQIRGLIHLIMALPPYQLN